MNQQHNNQAQEKDQVNHENEMDKIKNDHSRSEKVANAKTDADIAIISARGDAEVRRINLGVQMGEDEYRLRMQECERELQYKFDEMYSKLNQEVKKEDMHIELMKMLLENQYKQESQKTDVITGLLATMSQQNLLTNDSIKNIITFCQGILAKKD